VLVRVLSPLGLHGKEITPASLHVALEEGVHPALQRSDLGEIGGEGRERGRGGEVVPEPREDLDERARVVLEDAVHRFV